MKNKIRITDFRFRPCGHGQYQVCYTSPVTMKFWSAYTTDMWLIDVTKNADEPKKCHLEILKRLCKKYSNNLSFVVKDRK